MKVKYLLAVPVVALCFLLPSLAFGADEPVRIGDITAFTGEVLARTNGVWVKVKSAPHPVFSADKVVTRKGRAEIAFVDGGMMRLNLDSNASIEQVEDEEGFAFKNKVSARQVNLLVGEVWFSVKVEKGNKFKVRTPTMTAAVRGSAATIRQGVNPNEPAKYSHIEGDIETEGSYETVPPKALNWSDIRTNAMDLPSSNPTVDDSKLQRAANEATEVRSEALQAAAKAMDQTAEAQATGSIGDAYLLSALASVAMCDAAVLDKQAEMIAEQEKMIEAQVFGNVHETNEIQNNIGQLSQEISKRGARKGRLEQIKAEVDEAVANDEMKRAKELVQQSQEWLQQTLQTLREMVERQQQLQDKVLTLPESPPGEPTEEEVGYTEEETTTTTTTTSEPLPDTHDLPSSSPGY
jgi:hypothetical protein